MFSWALSFCQAKEPLKANEQSVEVLIYTPDKKAKARGGLAAAAKKDEQPTPRFQETLENRQTVTEAAALWHKTADARTPLGSEVSTCHLKQSLRNKKRFNPWPSPFTRYKTTEGARL